MAYLLDANVFIEAKNRYYHPDFCPAFWDWLLEANAAGKVFSIEKVSDEIAAGDDGLASWVGTHGSEFFLKPARPVPEALGRVNAWAGARNYRPLAIKRFMESADCYLVAQALEGKHKVVTLETPSGREARKRIKIPNACDGVGVEYLTPFEMLSREGARFVLGAPA